MGNKFSTRFGLRFRLTAVMIILMITTGIVTYYFNLWAERQIETQVNANINTLSQAFDLAARSLTSTEYLEDIIARSPIKDQFLDHRLHIFVTNEKNRIKDTSDSENSERQIGQELPIETPVNGAGPAVGPTSTLTNRINDLIGESPGVPKSQHHTFVFPLETTKGRHHLIIVMANPYVSQTIRETANQRLMIIVTIFAIAVLLTALLTYNFTRPLAAVARAAERVAGGELDTKVPIKRRDEIGELAGTFNYMIDRLQHQRELEDRLIQAEQSAIVGRLASGIAHEIRNPLNYINLSIDHVRSKFQPADERDRTQFISLLGTVKDEISRLNRIVTDFLNYGRPVKLSPKAINVRHLIEETIALVRQKADDQNVTIELAERGSLREIRGDPEQLKSCFSNIIINGMQALQFGGTLQIELEHEPEGVRVKIRDTGTGIPAEALDRIFEPYYSTKETGIGLGLAVTKRVIEQHRGAINVTSTVGEGTEFSIFLPNTLQTGDLSPTSFNGQDVARVAQ